MKGFQKNITVAVAVAIVLIGFGCHSGERADNVVLLWAMGAEGENVGALLPEFERRNPGIHVKVQSIPWTAAHEKLLTAYAGNSLPDVCQLGNTWIPEFTVLHSLVRLDTLVSASSSIHRESYFPGIWETNKIGPDLYGIPWYVDTRVMFYRKDILESVGYARFPRTWDEWYDASVKIRNQSAGGEHYAMLLPTTEWGPPVILGLQNGSSLLKDNDQYGDFSGSQFRNAFEYYQKFFRKHLAPIGVTQVTNIYQGIAEGYFAMYISGPWNIGEFSKRLPPVMQDKWMTAPLPNPISDSIPGASLAGGSSLVLFEGSRKKEMAWKLIEYLSAPEQQTAFYHLTGDLPARKESWQDTAFTNNVYIQAFQKQLEYVVPTPPVPEWERIAMKVQDYAELAAAGRLTVDEAVKQLDRDANIILEKHRWMVRKR